jgi:hypothetical protein
LLRHHQADHSRLRFNTVALRRQARQLSEGGQSRKRRLESSLPAPPELRIHDFIKNLNTTRLSAAAAATASSAAAVPASKRKLTPVELLRQHQVPVPLKDSGRGVRLMFFCMILLYFCISPP